MTRSSSNGERPVYLLGCGGHGRVVLDCLLRCGIPVAGIVDGALGRGERVDGVEVLGGDDYLGKLDARTTSLCIGVGVMPGMPRRADLFADCRRRGFRLVSVLHPSAVVAGPHEFGVGIQVLAGAVVQVGVRLGDNVIVNTAASVDHDCVIGPDVMIGPGAVLCGEVSVAARAYVGAASVILPGIRIGEGAVIGAGSVVTRHVAADSQVTGNPATRRCSAARKNA